MKRCKCLSESETAKITVSYSYGNNKIVTFGKSIIHEGRN